VTSKLASRFSGVSVAITGGTGYLASALRHALRDLPARTLVVSRRDIVAMPGEDVMKADIRTRECWERIVERADVVFHLAGNTSVYAAAKDPHDSLLSTVLPLTHLTAAASQAHRKLRVLYASTATVYGLTTRLPVAEDAPTNPITVYDLHKLCAERHLALASWQGLLDGMSLRLANVYGPSPTASSSEDRGILNKVTRLALQGSPLYLYCGGGYVRDYVYVDDVIRALMTAAVQEGMNPGSFNVASGVGWTIRDAFHLVSERADRITGKKTPVHDAPCPSGADPIEFRNFTADITCFSAACGWQPEVSLPEGIDRLIASLVEAKE
jgi:nucleoside-diphosphate-sugar epimerase